jgi:hypothetical protein
MAAVMAVSARQLSGKECSDCGCLYSVAKEEDCCVAPVQHQQQPVCIRNVQKMRSACNLSGAQSAAVAAVFPRYVMPQVQAVGGQQHCF